MARTLVIVGICLISSLGAACGAGTDTDDDDSTAPDGSNRLSTASCAPFAESLVAAAADCGTPIPAGGEDRFAGWCRDGIEAASMCGGDPAGGLDCFATADPSDWMCAAGAPLPACDGDLASALGAFCVVALGNPSCASGIACEYDIDCGSGARCNSVTQQCFDDGAYCVGLPCDYDVDCPSGESCNSAEHACIAG
jgi:hypothetical protein